jgi:hypothetical protein
MLNDSERGFRISKLTDDCRAALAVLVDQTGATLADVAKMCGTSFDQTEKALCHLVHEGLATRSNASRTYGVFRAA